MVELAEVGSRGRKRLPTHRHEVVAELHRELFPGDDEPPIIPLEGHDYPVRLLLPRDRLAAIVHERVFQLTWTNVKGEALRATESPEEARVRGLAYHDAWAAMLRLEELHGPGGRLGLRPRRR